MSVDETGVEMTEGSAPAVGRAASPEKKAWCPLDDWIFSPRYTDGVCPLCGWRPEGSFAEPPLFARIDWFWPSIGVLLVVSVIMGVLVVIAYNRA